jgi:hypothetical protein
MKNKPNPNAKTSRIRVRMKGIVMTVKGSPEALDKTLKAALQFIGQLRNH